MMRSVKRDLEKALSILYGLNLDEDVRQDAALRLCRTIHDFDPNRGSINTWVWYAVKKVRYIENRRRAQQYQNTVPMEGIMDGDYEPGEEDLSMKSFEFMDAVQNGLSKEARWIALLAIRNGVQTKGEILEKCLSMKKKGRTKPVAWTHRSVKKAFDELKEFLR